MNANERLVLDMLRAVERRDAERILEIFAPDAEFLWPPSLPGYGGSFRGEDVLAMNTAFTDAWDPLQPTDEARRLHARVVASNEQEVVVLYRQGGVNGAGMRCDTEVLALYAVDGGKVVRLQMFYFEPEKIGTFLKTQARLRAAEHDAQPRS